MELNYTSCEEFNSLIKEINDKYYERFNANILFLEELNDRIFVIYIIELRDAYSHLIRVYDYDILSEQGKKNVQHHLEKYVSHLQKGLLDTFRKILALEFKFLMNSITYRDKKAIVYQIAKKTHELRIMGKDISVDNRIEGYKSLLEHMAEIRERFIKK